MVDLKEEARVGTYGVTTKEGRAAVRAKLNETPGKLYPTSPEPFLKALDVLDSLDVRVAQLESYCEGWAKEVEDKTADYMTKQEFWLKRIAQLEAALEKADKLVRVCNAVNGWCAGCHSGCDGCDMVRDYQAARAKVKP